MTRGIVREFLRGALVAACLVAASVPTLAQPSPVSHWPFDTAPGGVTPDVADSNPGTLVGPVSLTPSPLGNALSFAGNPFSFVDFGVKANLNPSNAFTIDVWVKPMGIPGGFGWGGAGYVLSNGRDCCGWDSGGYGLHLAGPATGRPLHAPRAYFYRPDNSQVDVDGIAMSQGQWHNIVVVFNGTSLKLFQDGCLTAVTTFPATTLKPGTTRLVAGAHVPGLTCCNFPFLGEIDELKIYNQALAGPSSAPAATLVCPPNVDVTIPCEQSGYDGDIGSASVSGACPGQSYTITVSPAGPYPPGTTAVTWTATSDSGPPLTCQQTVAVTALDTEAPSASASASPATLWPPNHKLVPISISVSATDNCDAAGSLSSQILSVTSNEPLNGLGDGDTDNDWEITGPLSLSLRAERSGKGSGRVYTITVETTDGSGNSSTSTVTVSVPKSQGN